MPNPGLMIDASGNLTVNARGELIIGDVDSPCCCGGQPGCCDSIVRLVECPGDSHYVCCSCGEAYTLDVEFFRRTTVSIRNWADAPFDTGGRPAPPNGLWSEDFEQFHIRFRVGCDNGVRTVTPMGVQAYQRTRRQWDISLGSGGQYVLIEDVNETTLAAIIANSFITDRWCGADFLTFIGSGSSLGNRIKVTRPHYTSSGGTFPGGQGATLPGPTWTDCPGGWEFSYNVAERLSPWPDTNVGTPIQHHIAGEYHWVGQVSCAGGHFNDGYLGLWIGDSGQPFAETRSGSTADWSLTDRVPCSPDPCDGFIPDPVGACCFTTVPQGGFGGVQNCLTLTEAQCQARNGSYRGDGTACATVTPPCPTLGKCCLPDGTCTHTTALLCALRQGVYAGDGTVCSGPAPCGPVGACCLPGGCVDGLTEDGCIALGGAYYGDGTTCATATPPCVTPPIIGSCCLPDGTCVQGVNQAECAAKQGQWAITPCTGRACVSFPPNTDNPPTIPGAITGGGCSGCGQDIGF